MQLETACLRKSGAAVDAMTDVVEVDGLSRVDAWNAFHVLVEHLWDRDDRARGKLGCGRAKFLA